MKLNIGNNIRKYRKQADMTQEQLADKLGTTYQSVSRWENGSTYPDMELLPILAKLFGVSVDELLGIPDEKKEEAALETFKKLAQASLENPVNTEKVIELIRDIRLNYLDSKHFWHFWLNVRNSVYRMPEILPEVRQTVETILDGNYDIWQKNQAISHWAENEDDEHIGDFIERYASPMDLGKDKLLSNRYKIRGETEKAEPLRQLFLFNHIDELIGNRSLWVKPENFIETADILDTLLARSDLQLQLLHSLCCQTPDIMHPISGDGELDLFVEDRIFHLGLRRVGYLASSGDISGAFIVLEDVVSLLEKVMKITSPAELRCSSPWLDATVWTAEEDWSVPGGNFLLSDEEERCIYIHNPENWCYMIYPSWVKDILTSRSGHAYTQEWHWLDPLRNDARYKDYIDRVSALIVTRPKKKE